MPQQQRITLITHIIKIKRITAPTERPLNIYKIFIRILFIFYLINFY
jgi:hypothetical protein